MDFKHSSIQGLIIDLDDIDFEKVEIRDLKLLFDQVKQINLRHTFVTRSSINPPRHYIRKFAECGIEIQLDQILTPAIVTVQQIRDWFLPGMTVFTVGEAGLYQALTQARYRVVNRSSENIENIDFVCIDPQVRIDRQTSEIVNKLKMQGAPLITIDKESCLSHNLNSISKIESVRASISSNLSPPPLFAKALDWLGSDRNTTVVLGYRSGRILSDAKEAGFKQIVDWAELKLGKNQAPHRIYAQSSKSEITHFIQPETGAVMPHRQKAIKPRGSIFYTLN